VARARTGAADAAASASRRIYADGFRVDISARPGVARLASASSLARAIRRGLVAGGAPRPASVGLVLSDDVELAELNADFMGASGPTDVLSFPLLPPEAYPPHPGRAEAGGPQFAFVSPPGARPHLGDIVVSVERAVAQADQGCGGQTGDVRWSPVDELRLLVTHGALHLCGWDHAEPAEEAAMRTLERELLARDR
jgi:probable rRNA maturation factor